MLSEKPYKAIVLAGSSKSRLEAGIPSKALLAFRDKPLVSYVLAALKKSSLIAEVIYVGPEHPDIEAYIDISLSPTESFAENLRLAFEASEGFPTLISTNDIPLISAAQIDHFIQDAPKADMVYPIVTKELCETEFPNLKRTYVRLKDGSFTGGNMILCQAEAQAKVLAFAARAYQARKSPLAMARLIGLSTVLGLILGQLRLENLEKRIGQVMGLTVKAWVSPSAAIATDVDKIEQLKALEAC
ncbi:MAG: NTP transferase domain-containing protein [Deinococcales bacterium]